MLTRIYIDNFRCFTNCELNLEPLTLLLGPNGAGKTSVLEIIDGLRKFVFEGLALDDLTPAETLTRWDKRLDQRFSLTVELECDAFTYELVVRHTQDKSKRKVLTERLTCAGTPLFLFDEKATAHLFDDAGTKRAEAPFDWSRSSLGVLRSGPDNTRLTRFRDWLANIQLIRPDPRSMESRSERAMPLFAPSLRNFASWLRGRFEEDPSGPFTMIEELKHVIGGFVGLRNEDLGGNFKRLEAKLASSDNVQTAQKPYTVAFDELSDGQKLLIALYGILNLSLSTNKALLIDEPDNYLGLAEVQPWFNRLQDVLQSRGGQAIVVSHHPEILDLAAVESGRWLSRPDNAHVRVRPFKEIADQFDGAAPNSEIIARGWTS